MINSKTIRYQDDNLSMENEVNGFYFMLFYNYCYHYNIYLCTHTFGILLSELVLCKHDIFGLHFWTESCAGTGNARARYGWPS